MEHIDKPNSGPCGGGFVHKSHELEFIGAFTAKCSICGAIFDMNNSIESDCARNTICSPRHHKWVARTHNSDVCRVCGKVIYAGEREYGDCDWLKRGTTKKQLTKP